jgi:hypothetical protein
MHQGNVRGGCRMQRGISLAWAVVLIGCCGSASLAQTPGQGPPAVPSQANCCTAPLLSGCADDYCRKPCPPIHRLPSCGLPDDYCGKPWPRIWTLPCCGQPDDYCRKPCPTVCRPLCLDHYTCGQGCSQHRSAPIERVPNTSGWQPGGTPVIVQERAVPAPRQTGSPYHPQR